MINGSQTLPISSTNAKLFGKNNVKTNTKIDTHMSYV